MATQKLGIDATNMGDPSLGAAGFIRQPTADTSGLVMTGLALDVASEIPNAWAGYENARLESEQEKVIDEYLERKKNPLIMEQTAVEIGALDMAEESIWKKVASDADYQPDVDDFSAVDQALQQKLSKFQAARDQGVMSPEEFTDRILATTREAINRNPGLYDRLKQHSARVLEMSGIMDIVKADAAAAKAQQDELTRFKNDIVDLAKKHDVPLYTDQNGLPDYGRIKTEVDKIQVQKQAVTLYENKNKLVTEADKERANAFMRNNGTHLVNGLINSELDKGIAIINQGGDVQGALTQIRMGLNSAYQTFLGKVGPIIDNPKVKAAITMFETQQKFVEEMIGKAATKEDAVRLSNNLKQMLQNDQYQEVSKYVNPEQLAITTQILNTVGGARILEQNPELMGNMITTFGDLLSGVSGSPRVNYDASVNGKNVVAAGLNELAKQTLLDPKNGKHLEKAISAISADTQNPDKFQTTDQKFRFYEKLIRELGDPAINKAFARVGAGTISQATGLVDDYMNLTVGGMRKTVADWEGKGVKVELDVLPDGRVMFKANNPQATQDLNSRYTSRINDSLATMSNLMGLDTKSVAAQQFYPQYIPSIVGDKDLQPRYSVKTKAAADLAVKEGRMSQQEYQAITASGFGNNAVNLSKDKTLSQLEDKILSSTGEAYTQAVNAHRKYLREVYGIEY